MNTDIVNILTSIDSNYSLIILVAILWYIKLEKRHKSIKTELKEKELKLLQIVKILKKQQSIIFHIIKKNEINNPEFDLDLLSSDLQELINLTKEE